MIKRYDISEYLLVFSKIIYYNKNKKKEKEKHNKNKTHIIESFSLNLD